MTNADSPRKEQRVASIDARQHCVVGVFAARSRRDAAGVAAVGA